MMTRILLLLLIAGTAGAQTATPAPGCLAAGASTRVTMGTFTTEDGTTPVAPTNVTYEMYLPKTQFKPKVQVVAPATVAGGTSVVVTLSSTATSITDASVSELRPVFSWDWTWAGTCGGAPCKGSKWQELRFCRPPL